MPLGILQNITFLISASALSTPSPAKNLSPSQNNPTEYKNPPIPIFFLISPTLCTTK
jgi:hypothetical protein